MAGEDLEAELGVLAATSIDIGTMIGGGIFIPRASPFARLGPRV